MGLPREEGQIFQLKYKKTAAGIEFIGTDIKKSDIINFTAAETTITAAAGIYSTGEIPAPRASYINDRYLVENGTGKITDSFDDETSLYIETERGIVILLGCSHKGIKNIIDEIRTSIGDQKIAAVLGGMHLKREKRKEIRQLIEYFKELDLDLLAPMHCTGRQAAVTFKEALGDVVQLASVGDNFKI